MVFSLQPLRAENPAETAAQNLAALAARVDSLHFKGSVSVEMDPAYVEKVKKQGRDVPDYVVRQNVAVEYFYHAGKYSFGVEHKYGDGKILGSVTKCWDGERYQTLFAHTGLLSVSTQPEKLEERYWWLLQGTLLPLLPFGFLNPDLERLDGEQAVQSGILWVHPSEVASVENWQRFLKQAVLQKPAPGEKKVVYRLEYPYVYDLIAFTPPDYYPSSFTRYDKQGQKLKEYEVLEKKILPLDPKTGWPVPVQARYSWYYDSVLTRTDKLKIEEITVNDPSLIDDARFFIDPIKAEKIYDADSGKYVMVPR
jgi:hypothetical protein